MDNEQQDRLFTDSNKTESELIPDTENNNSNETDVNVECKKDKIIDKFIVIKFQENDIFLLFSLFILFNLKISLLYKIYYNNYIKHFLGRGS